MSSRRRKDLFNQLDGLLGNPFELEEPQKQIAKKKSSSSIGSTKSNSSIQNRIAMFENNDVDSSAKIPKPKPVQRKPSGSSTATTNNIKNSSSTRAFFQSSAMESTPIDQSPPRHTKLTHNNSISSSTSSSSSSSARKTSRSRKADTSSSSNQSYYDHWDASTSNSDTEFDEQSTHTAETSIYFDSPPRKINRKPSLILSNAITSTHLQAPTGLSTPSPSPMASSAANSHRRFQNKLRIGTSTLNNLSGMLDCVEAMVLSENQLIQDQLEQFTKTIQESPAHNTYSIKLSI